MPSGLPPLQVRRCEDTVAPPSDLSQRQMLKHSFPTVHVYSEWLALTSRVRAHEQWGRKHGNLQAGERRTLSCAGCDPTDGAHDGISRWDALSLPSRPQVQQGLVHALDRRLLVAYERRQVPLPDVFPPRRRSCMAASKPVHSRWRRLITFNPQILCIRKSSSYIPASFVSPLHSHCIVGVC